MTAQMYAMDVAADEWTVQKGSSVGLFDEVPEADLAALIERSKASGVAPIDDVLSVLGVELTVDVVEEIRTRAEASATDD